MASLWNLDACTAWLAQKFPGVLKTSNPFYRAVLTPRNLAAPMKVHDHNIFDWFIKLHTVNTQYLRIALNNTQYQYQYLWMSLNNTNTQYQYQQKTQYPILYLITQPF